ncbi:MAG: M23 family metallopeptidase [Betaproteobacteria bacterium]
MDIILVSGRMAKARSYTVTGPQLAFVGMLALLAIVSGAVLLNYFSLRYAVANNSPLLHAFLADAQAQESRKAQSYLRDSLNTMASKLGEMQAQLFKLNSVGERVSKLAGFKPQELTFDAAPAFKGGALVTTAPLVLSLDDLKFQIDELSRQVDDGSDKFGVLESTMMEVHARKQLLPSGLPVNGGLYSSNFGWRVDPFTGLSAFHEGVDFMGEIGTPIHAAAGGVVITSELHPQYGNMIEIDHGNGLVTRYGHASKRTVKVGDLVLRGSKIGEVGSTGRSTGPHLHFEVRLRGVAQNPARFLQPSS